MFRKTIEVNRKIHAFIVYYCSKHILSSILHSILECGFIFVALEIAARVVVFGLVDLLGGRLVQHLDVVLFKDNRLFHHRVQKTGKKRKTKK